MHLVGRTLLASLLALTTFSAMAQPNEAAIKQRLTAIGIAPSSITASPVSGLNEVVTERGIIYVSDDGEYLLLGNLFKNTGAEPVNLTEQKMASLNKVKLAALAKDMIVYPAKDEKYVVTIFTDTSCGYCRKLHNEMKGYNDAGITVRYLAFPRGGERSKNFAEMSAIWGAEQRVIAMDEAKQGQFSVGDKALNKEMVLQQYELGLAMGVSGTPAIVLQDGTMIPGYQPPAQLLQLLKSRANAS